MRLERRRSVTAGSNVEQQRADGPEVFDSMDARHAIMDGLVKWRAKSPAVRDGRPGVYFTCRRTKAIAPLGVEPRCASLPTLWSRRVESRYDVSIVPTQQLISLER